MKSLLILTISHYYPLKKAISSLWWTILEWAPLKIPSNFDYFAAKTPKLGAKFLIRIPVIKYHPYKYIGPLQPTNSASLDENIIKSIEGLATVLYILARELEKFNMS